MILCLESANGKLLHSSRAEAAAVAQKQCVQCVCAYKSPKRKTECGGKMYLLGVRSY